MVEIREVTYKATIKGKTPLLMNRPSALIGDISEGKTKGSDLRIPKEQAKEKLYQIEETLYQPSTHLRGCLIEAGKEFSVKGKGKATYSKIIGYSVEVNPMEIPHKKTKWEVFSILTVNPNTKGRSMTHRPMFRDWELEFNITFNEAIIHPDVLKEILDTAGKIVGIGDWRPAKKGTFGKFDVVKFEKLKSK